MEAGEYPGCGSFSAVRNGLPCVASGANRIAQFVTLVRPITLNWSNHQLAGMTGISPKRAAWTAALLLLVGAVIRLAGVGLHSLWLDEATTLQFARHDLAGCLYAEVNNPPLHRLLIHYWIQLVGDGSDALLRLPAALFGALAGIGVWALARRVLSPTAALIALALFVLDPYHLLLSQELRAYSLLVLLATLTWFLHLSTLESPDPAEGPWPRRFRAFAFTVILAAGLYTHYQFAWVALVVAGHRLVRAWRQPLGRVVRLLAPLVLAALAFAPWAWVFASHVGAQARGYTTNLPGRILSLPFMLLLGESAAVRQYPETYLQAALRHLWLLAPFAVAVAPLLVFGVRALWRRGEESRFLLLAAATPLVGLAVLFPWLPLFTARYLAFLMPVLCVVVAAGAVTLRWHRVGAMAVAVILALQGLSLGRYHLDPRFGREDWRGAAAWVSARERPGDVILFDHDYVHIPFDRYYQGAARERGMPTDPAGRRATLGRLTRHPPARLFLVLSHAWDAGRKTVRALETRLCRRGRHVFRPSNGIEVHLFVRCAKTGLRN